MVRAILKAAAWCSPIASTFLLVLGYGSGPAPAHTGGFGEKTCLRCHSDFALNEGRLKGGSLEIHGVPKTYVPGSRYELTIELAQPGQSRWGFQLSARFSENGRQAGELLPLDGMTQVKQAGAVQFIEHTKAGSREAGALGRATFRFAWIAPPSDLGPVLFNAAGNAANDDDDSTGDYIYTSGAFSDSRRTPAVTSSAHSRAEREGPHRVSVSSRFMHMPAPVDLNRGSSEIHIEHRFIQALADSTPGTGFGIDAGANIYLAFNRAITDRLSAGVSRARFDQIVAFTGTFEILAGRNRPTEISLLGGVEGKQNFHRQYSPFLQLATSFEAGRMKFLASPVFILNSRDDRDLGFTPNPVNPADNYTFALGLGADLLVTPNLSIVAEAVPRLAGFGGFGRRDPALSAGIKLRSWGHVFTVMASTSRAFTPGQYAVNAEKDFSLGFNIYRRIH